MVLMPYLPNINLRDLMSRNKEMKNFGECEWAKDLDVEGKKEIIDQVVDRVIETHDQGQAWGETILDNMIITKDKRVVICDPETLYDEDVPQTQRMASDLRDITFSTTIAMLRSGDAQNPQEIVDQVLARYDNPEVTSALKRTVGKKLSLVQRLVYPIFEQARLGFKDMKEYDSIRQAILDFEPA